MMRVAWLLPTLMLVACAKLQPPNVAKTGKVSIAPPSSQLHYGGNSEAWIGPLGDMQDSAHCHAHLRLPLTEAAAWQYEYTSAEFSNMPPSTVLHYSGSVVVAAQSPQLLVLNAADGNVLANSDVYEHGNISQQEAFMSLYLSPAGRVLACDESTRFYCFDLPELQRLWLLDSRESHFYDNSDGPGFGSPLVTDSKNLYTMWGMPNTWMVHAVDIESGKRGWTYPLAARADLPIGVTLSRDGTLLTYALPYQLRAVRAVDGKPLWTAYCSSRVYLAPIDEEHQTVHVLLEDESVECRSLKDGSRLWRYGWSSLLSADQRHRLVEQSGLEPYGLNRDNLRIGFTGYCIGEGCSYLALDSDHIVKLDNQGKVVWQVKLDAAINGLTLFDNALLAQQSYKYPQAGHPQTIDAFNLGSITWKKPHPPVPVARNKIPRSQLWGRVVALNPQDGKILSAVEPDTLVESNICPAGGKIVFGGASNGSNRGTAKFSVVAYDWLEP
jgi:outer membrane protein assembly factor BamB